MRITITQHYLTFPIWQNMCDHDDLRLLAITCDGRFVYHFLMPVRNDMPGIAAPGEPVLPHDYVASIDVASYIGQTLEITGEMPEEYLALIGQSDEVVPTPEQTERPAFHYTTPYGWINDPNGMVYDNGLWHLYYQHNPMNVAWMNMSWGHAVSRDLVHFSFISDVMHPDEHGTIYSGCGLRNEHGCYGLPEDALLYFYTAAQDPTRLSGEHSTQRMAYSLDGGRTLIKYPDWELPCEAEGNRDPKITWYDEFGCYIISLYLDGYRFAIYRTTDLEHWEETQIIEIPPLWECPDLFKVTGEDGRSAWALTSADGYYVLGAFDGYTFTPTSEVMELYGGEIRKECTSGKLPYAAQAFSGTQGRTIAIAWLRIPNRGTSYTGAMGLARELTLAEDEHGLYIRQQFVQEAAEYVEEGDLGTYTEDAYIRESISDDGRFYTVEIVDE